MKTKVLKKYFLFSLIMTFLISSAVAIKTQEELLKALDLESSKVVLRALRNKHKVNLLTEFDPNIPYRFKKIQHALDFLAFAFNKKSAEVGTVYVRSLKELQSKFRDEELLAHKLFLDQWFKNKSLKYQQDASRPMGTFENSVTSEIMSDFVMVEESAAQVPPIPSTLTPFGGRASDLTGGYPIPTHVDLDVLAVLSGFVVIEEFNSLTDGEFITSTVMPSALAAMLSESAETSSLAAMPSTSADMSLILEDAPSPSAASSTSTGMSPALIDMLSTFTEHNELLSTLDEKSVKITLQALLNDYHIPSHEFNFKVRKDEDRYGNVVAYLMWTLHRKQENILRKKMALIPDSPRYRFYCYWYDTKLAKYDSRREIMLNPPEPPAKSPRPKLFRRGRK
ncbi:MAG: hypothetical protein K2W92_06825 [Alphaproteobacteria bacterium]|nr:hypothetical protein [Alphaproteobacteria bacterium]